MESTKQSLFVSFARNYPGGFVGRSNPVTVHQSEVAKTSAHVVSTPYKTMYIMADLAPEGRYAWICLNPHKASQLLHPFPYLSFCLTKGKNRLLDRKGKGPFLMHLPYHQSAATDMLLFQLDNCSRTSGSAYIKACVIFKMVHNFKTAF